MSCLQPPETLTEFVRVITCSAEAYAGPSWPTLALQGLIGWCFLAILVLAVIAAVRHAR